MPINVVTSSLYTHPGYRNLAVGLGLSQQPIAYDYGGNVVVQQDTVYANGNVSGTTQEYAAQAARIAETGQSAEPNGDTKWLPLGVFALVEANDSTSDNIFEIAVSQKGIIRGNYHNRRTDEIEPLSGAVDKETQRAAWTIGGDQTPIYESGIANLTKDETPLLVHLGEGQTRQVALVRLQQPDQ
ncbi:hypothetical protein [Crateriforma spongiae]|uniref:hypothetical protein n=1 Tax=Crateriforma spongiae TaxID=2724528 RepID=UPI00144816BD|nr:hypothetical protein [Crateriforma spongiae]